MLNVDFTPLNLMILGVLFAAFAIVAATIIGRRIARRESGRNSQSRT